MRALASAGGLHVAFIICVEHRVLLALNDVATVFNTVKRSSCKSPLS